MKKKKIAILTLYYQNYNYGGLLQAYALQKIIETMGYECKQITYKRRRRDVFFRKIRVILRMPYIEKKDFVLYYIDKIKRKTNKEKDISNRTIDKFNEFIEQNDFSNGEYEITKYKVNKKDNYKLWI